MTGRSRRATWVAGLGLAIVVVITGCSVIFPAAWDISDGGGPRGGNLIPIPTAPPVVPDEHGLIVCNMALLTGEVVSHPEWGIALGNGQGESYLVFWPNGYVGRVSGDDTELLDGDGEVVARTGDQIIAAGGGNTINGVEGFRICPGTIEVQGAEQ